MILFSCGYLQLNTGVSRVLTTGRANKLIQVIRFIRQDVPDVNAWSRLSGLFSRKLPWRNFVLQQREKILSNSNFQHIQNNHHWLELIYF